MTAPWNDPGSFDIPGVPSDADLRRAARVLRMGGAVGGAPVWSLAVTRALTVGGLPRLSADEDVESAQQAYARVQALLRANAPAPSGAIHRATVR